MGLDMKLEDFMKELGRQREEDQEFKVEFSYSWLHSQSEAIWPT